MRRALPLLLLLLTGLAAASGITNVLLGAAAYVTYSGTVTAANPCPTANIGYSSSNSCGSISPGADNEGNAVEAVYTNGTTSILEIAGNRGQGYFATLKVNGTSYVSSSATYSYNMLGNFSQWIWTGAFFGAAGNYSVSYH